MVGALSVLKIGWFMFGQGPMLCGRLGVEPIAIRYVTGVPILGMGWLHGVDL